MLSPSFLLGLALFGQTEVIESPHRENTVYRSLLEEGLTIEGTHLEFDKPALRDGQPARSQRESLIHVVGSVPRLEELLRDSVTAPFILKLRDETLKSGDLIRRGDLWFVVHADLAGIKPRELWRRGTENQEVSAGNMRFASHLLTDKERLNRGLGESIEERSDFFDWFVHLDGRLLGRISVQVTDHAMATRARESWVVASRTDPRFNDDKEYSNHWRSLETKNDGERSLANPFPGGASYLKISSLAEPAGALLVESHFAFVEPRAWFEGEPILRSKINLVAQDQIRRLRRELAKAKSQ